MWNSDDLAARAGFVYEGLFYSSDNSPVFPSRPISCGWKCVTLSSHR